MSEASLPYGETTARLLVERLAELSLELCHAEWTPGRRGKLALTIDRPGGVTLDDCEAASHAASEVLDALDGTPAEMPPHVLEVASPGLDRRLFSPEDCARFVGRRVLLRLARKMDGTGRLKGALEAVAGDALTVLDEDQKRRYTVSFGDVKVARLVPDA